MIISVLGLGLGLLAFEAQASCAGGSANTRVGSMRFNAAGPPQYCNSDGTWKNAEGGGGGGASCPMQTISWTGPSNYYNVSCSISASGGNHSEIKQVNDSSAGFGPRGGCDDGSGAATIQCQNGSWIIINSACFGPCG